MQEQEKHPIDELFANRLRDAEQPPSVRAWDELQRRTAKKEGGKPTFWLYAVAASVLLLAGCFFWLDTGAPSPNHVALKPENRQPQPQKSILRQMDKSAGKTPVTESPKPRGQEVVGEKQLTPENEKLAAGKNPLRPERNAQGGRKNLQNPENQLFDKPKSVIPQSETETIALSESASRPIAEPMQPKNTVAETGETAAHSAMAANNAVNVTIVTVEIENAPPKNSKAEKLWQTLKKVKKAELTLDKETVMSWVKDRTNGSRGRQ